MEHFSGTRICSHGTISGVLNFFIDYMCHAPKWPLQYTCMYLHVYHCGKGSSSISGKILKALSIFEL